MKNYSNKDYVNKFSAHLPLNAICPSGPIPDEKKGIYIYIYINI